MEILTVEGIMHKLFHEPSLKTDYTANNKPIFVTKKKRVTNSLYRYWPSSLSSSSSPDEELSSSSLSSLNPCASSTTFPQSKPEHRGPQRIPFFLHLQLLPSEHFFFSHKYLNRRLHDPPNQNLVFHQR